jgi:hypothetical protein
MTISKRIQGAQSPRSETKKTLKIVGDARLSEHMPVRQFEIVISLSLFFLSSLKNFL